MAGRLTIDDDSHPVPGGVTLLGNIVSDTTIVVGSVNAKAIAIVDNNGNQIVSFGGSSLVTTPLPGQAKIAVTGTAVQLGANTLTNGVIVTAKSTNSANILIGTSGVTNTFDGTGNGYILEPGNSVSFAVTNTNKLYINGTAGDIVSFAGS